MQDTGREPSNGSPLGAHGITAAHKRDSRLTRDWVTKRIRRCQEDIRSGRRRSREFARAWVAARYEHVRAVRLPGTAAVA